MHSFGRRIASHCTWAERVEERRGLQDDCVINVPSYQVPPPSLPPLFLFLRCKWSQHDFLSSKRRCSVSIAADDADACVCGCMLVGHLTRPVAHCPPTLTMIDVSSFIFFLFFSFSRLSVRESWALAHFGTRVIRPSLLSFFVSSYLLWFDSSINRSTRFPCIWRRATRQLASRFLSILLLFYK